MKVTRQEVQIAGVVAVFLAAIYYAFGEVPLLAHLGATVRHIARLSPTLIFALLGLFALLLPAAIPLLQRIIQKRELPAIEIAPENSLELFRRTQREVQGMFLTLALLLAGTTVIGLITLPGSRLHSQALEHVRVLGLLRGASRTSALYLPARAPASGWQPYLKTAQEQMHATTLTEAPVLRILVKFASQDGRWLERQAAQLPSPIGRTPLEYAEDAWSLPADLAPEDKRDLASLYALLGRFLLAHSEDGRLLGQTRVAEQFLNFASALGSDRGVIDNARAVCHIAMFLRPVTRRDSRGTVMCRCTPDWGEAWQARRLLESASDHTSDPAILAKIANNELYLDMRMYAARFLYGQSPPDSLVIRIDADHLSYLDTDAVGDSLLKQCLGLANRSAMDQATFRTTYCQALMLRAALRARRSAASAGAMHQAFESGVAVLLSEDLREYRRDFLMHLTDDAECERYFFGAFSRCDPHGVRRQQLVQLFRADTGSL